MEAPEPYSTRRLANAAHGGDRQSFELLFEQVAPALYAWSSLHIAGQIRRRLEPDDVVQEVFCRACSIFAKSFDPEKVVFRAWLFRVAKNVLYEGLKRARAMPAEFDAGESRSCFDGAEVPAEATSITERVARRDDVARLTSMIESLPQDDRALVTCCGLEGRPLADAANRLGIALEATKKRWQRLRERLRTQLGGREAILDESA